MFGVFPIIPCVYAPTFHIPMSSPKMTRMFGFLACACAAPTDTTTPSATQRLLHHVIRMRLPSSTLMWAQHTRGATDETVKSGTRRDGRTGQPPGPGPERSFL